MLRSQLPEAAKIVFILLACCLIARAQVTVINWRVDADVAITAKDKLSIIKLAKQTGIDDPANVSVEYPLPLGGHFLKVESSVTIEGPHRSWREIKVCRQDWKGYCYAGKPRKVVGRWQTSITSVTQRQTWRVQEQGWFIDVSTDTNVTYRDAERIVLAIRGGKLVNPLNLSTAMLIDANEITYISQHGPEVSTFEVHTGRASGLLLRVKVAGDIVELQELLHWMA
jgi:hypothetical protein